MSVIRIVDVAYVRFRAPDLAVMRMFLENFGMIVAQADDDRLAMRGYGTDSFLHMTEPGPPGFVGFGFHAASLADLEAIAAHDGASVETSSAPGGGSIVRLSDPDGFAVEVVFGQQPAAALPTPGPLAWNERGEQRRVARFRRIAKGPSHVLRLGHVVLSVADFPASERWYKERFGLITSDEIQAKSGDAIGAFMRADRGDLTSDHHTLFLFQQPGGAGFMHSAFEVVDLDDLMAGRDHLAARGYRPAWGIGRHLLGSQIFDYWTDPWGHEIEHWTDGDQLRAADGGGVASVDQLLGVQWGMPFPGQG